MELDYRLLKISTNVVANSIVSGPRLAVPANLDISIFKSIYNDQIYQISLTPEKAFYVVMKKKRTKFLDTKALLTKRLRK